MPLIVSPPVGPLGGTGVPGTPLHDGLVMLGDITFGGTDDYGVEWVLSSLTGWSDPPASTGAVEQRVADHGGWANRAYYTPRTMELAGTLLASDWAGASEALDRLFEAVPLDAVDWMVVDEGYRALQAKVRQDGDPLVERLNGWARFSLSLVAPDPRRYSLDEPAFSTGLPVTSGGFVVDDSTTIIDAFTLADASTSGVITLTNDGNFTTPWTGYLTGPVPAGSIVTLRSADGSAKVLHIPQDVPTGRTLVLDSGFRSARLDGTALRVVTGTWFDLAPGANEIAFSAPSYDPGALFSVVFRPAFR